MSSFQLIQTSDIHLSRERPYFFHNWDVVVERINKQNPDLVVCTGDLTFNGADIEKDLVFARRQLERIQTTVMVVPGNHDVGNCPPDVRGEHIITDARRDRYLHYFGQDYWFLDKAGWRFIGVNSLLFGSGLSAETEQLKWLTSVLTEGRQQRRCLALFFHKPLYLWNPSDEGLRQHSVYPGPREKILSLLEKYRVDMVATGHVHEYRCRRFGKTRMVWCPSTAFIYEGKWWARHGGIRRVGYLEYQFEGKKVTHRRHEPMELINHDVGNWLKDGLAVYLKHATGVFAAPL